jgi:hypothetical protein
MAGLFRTHSRVRGSPDGCGYQIGHIRPPGSSLRSFDCRQIRPTTHNCAPLVSLPCWKVGMRTTRCRRSRVPIINCRIMPGELVDEVRGTRPRPLRRAILAGPSPSCAHDHARLRLPAIPPPQKSEVGKKESTDRRLNQACRPSVTPSSRSSLNRRRGDAHTAENGSA